MAQTNRKVQYLVTLSASIATLTMGVASGWTTPVLPKFRNNETVVSIDQDGISWMITMGPPGFVVGSLLTGFILNRVGRRGLILLSSFPYCLGMILAVTAVNSWMLCLMQFLWQIGSGICSTALMLYFSEIADKDIRGTLSLVTRITFNFGSLMMMCVGPHLNYNTLNQLICVLPVMYLICCWWIPESPYHYLKDGKTDAARKVLLKLRGYKDEQALNDELARIQEHVKHDMRRSTSVKELFTGRQYRKAIIIAAGLKLTAILTGLQTVNQYLGLILEESKINLTVKTTLTIFGIIKFVISFMPSLLVDKVGRRPLLILSYLGTSVCLVTVGAYFFIQNDEHVNKDVLSAYAFVTFIAIILSHIVSSMGFNSLISLIPGEIFPMNVKAAAFSSLGVFGGLVGMVTGKTYQSLKNVTGLCGVFWIYAAVAFSGAIFSWIFVPETKGKSLEEIQILLQGELYNDIQEEKSGIDSKYDKGDETELKELNRTEKESEKD